MRSDPHPEPVEGPIGPGMVGLGQAMLDAVLDTDAIENVRSEKLSAWPSPVLRQIGEGHAVVGQHRGNLVEEGSHDGPEEGCFLLLSRSIVEFDVYKLLSWADFQEYDQLAVGVAQTTTVDMHVANLVDLEALARLRRLVGRKAGDAVPLQTSMQSGAAQVGDRVAQAAQDTVERQKRPTPKHDHDGLLGRRQDRALRLLRAHRSIARQSKPTPFGDRLRVQPVRGGQGAAIFLRRLELSSNTRRRSGAAVKNACHRPSSS
jgi:hypothetical protein